MMTREQCQNLRSALQRTLDELGTKLGYKLRLGNCSYAETANFKLECSPLDGEGKAITKEESDFKKLAPLYGLSSEDLGREFVAESRFKIIGWKSSSRKFPVLVRRCHDGKAFKFSIEAIKLHLAKAPVA